jgi:hypothetical protein
MAEALGLRQDADPLQRLTGSYSSGSSRKRPVRSCNRTTVTPAPTWTVYFTDTRVRSLFSTANFALQRLTDHSRVPWVRFLLAHRFILVSRGCHFCY